MAQLEFAETKVEYRWRQDRFDHVISILTSDGWMELLQSVEGTNQDPWPISPPWQQMVRESMGHVGEDVLLGVGLSGNGHWSIAVHPTNSEPSQDQSALFRGLAFDIACKTSKPATRLGSLWKIAPLWSLPAQDEINYRQIVFQTRSPGKPVSVHVSVIHGIAKIEQDGVQTYLNIMPETAIETPQTHRWAIRVETPQERGANEPFA